MTLIDAKNYNTGSIGANGTIIKNNNSGSGGDNASAPLTNHLNAGVHTGVTGTFTANVRYSGVTRVMVDLPKQCSAHMGVVCSKHKTVTIALNSI